MILNYILFTIPVYLCVFIWRTRKTNDVNFGELIAMTLCACIPLLREIIAISMLLEDTKLFDSVVFKKMK
jgi:hypothetical protein